MPINHLFSTTRRWVPRLVILGLLLALGAPAAIPSASAGIAPPLLQFTSGGHIIGFAPTQVVLAAFDHALRVEFVGTVGVAPVAASADTASSNGAPTMGRANRSAW